MSQIVHEPGDRPPVSCIGKAAAPSTPYRLSQRGTLKRMMLV